MDNLRPTGELKGMAMMGLETDYHGYRKEIMDWMLGVVRRNRPGGETGKGGNKVRWHKESVSLATDEGMLYAELLLPEGEGAFPGAVLCHGFGADRRAMGSSAGRLVRQGIAALIFDFRGHGRSEGMLDGTAERDVVAALDFLRHHPKVDAQRLALVGHSMGALAAIRAAGQLDHLTAFVVLCTPSEMEGRMKSTAERFVSSIYHKAAQVGSFVFEYPRQGSLPGVGRIAGIASLFWMRLGGFRLTVDWKKTIEFWGRQGLGLASGVEKLGAFPKLFVHCKGDRVTPYEGALELYRRAGEPKELFLSECGFHSLPLLPGRLRRKWIAWLVSVLTQAKA